MYPAIIAARSDPTSVPLDGFPFDTILSRANAITVDFQLTVTQLYPGWVPWNTARAWPSLGLANSRLKAQRFDRVAFIRSVIPTIGHGIMLFEIINLYLLLNHPSKLQRKWYNYFSLSRVTYSSSFLFFIYLFISIFMDIFSVPFIRSMIEVRRRVFVSVALNKQERLHVAYCHSEYTVSSVYFARHFNASRLITRSRWNVRLNDEPMLH